MIFDTVYKLISSEKIMGKYTFLLLSFARIPLTSRTMPRIITNELGHGILGIYNLKCHIYSPELQLYLNRT